MEDLKLEAEQLIDQLAQDFAVAPRLYPMLLRLFERQIEKKPSTRWVQLRVDKITDELISAAVQERRTVDPARTKKDVLAVLRRLDQVRFGELLMGRKGKKTRFIIRTEDDDDTVLLEVLKARVDSTIGDADQPSLRKQLAQHLTRIEHLVGELRSAQAAAARVASRLTAAS